MHRTTSFRHGSEHAHRKGQGDRNQSFFGFLVAVGSDP